MDSVSGKTFPTINPVTEEKICDVAEGDKVSIIILWYTIVTTYDVMIISARGGDFHTKGAGMPIGNFELNT